MKNIFPFNLIAVFSIVIALSACNSSFDEFHKKNEPNIKKTPYIAPQPKFTRNEEDSLMEKNQLGVSSMTVEHLALKNQCVPKGFASLLSPAGSKEIYHVDCDNDQFILARCELRQCKIMTNEEIDAEKLLHR